MTLSDLDGKRIAVVLPDATGPTIVRGKAMYVVDKDLGKCLRVRLLGELGDPHLCFSDSADEFEIRRDDQYGCDYQVTIGFDANGRGMRSSRQRSMTRVTS